MKIDTIKLIIALAICGLLGYLCYTIAPETDSRNWISLIVTALSLFFCVGPAIAVKVVSVGDKTVSTKLVGWIFFFILLLVNFLFSRNEYRISTYIIVVVISALVAILIMYSISKS